MAKQTKNIDEYVAGLEPKEEYITGNESVLINDDEDGTNKRVSIKNLVVRGIAEQEHFYDDGSILFEYLHEEGSMPIYIGVDRRMLTISVSDLLKVFFNNENTLGIQRKLTGIYEWYDSNYKKHTEEDAPVIFPNGIAFSYSRDRDGSFSSYVGIEYNDGEIVLEPDVKINGFLHATEIYSNYIESTSIGLKKDNYESPNGKLIEIAGVQGSANEVYNTAGRYTEVYSKSEIDELLKNLKESLTTK